MKGLKFSILSKKLNYADYLIILNYFIEVFIYNLDSISNENLDFVKTKIKDAVLTSLIQYESST